MGFFLILVEISLFLNWCFVAYKLKASMKIPIVDSFGEVWRSVRGFIGWIGSLLVYLSKKAI